MARHPEDAAPIYLKYAEIAGAATSDGRYEDPAAACDGAAVTKGMDCSAEFVSRLEVLSREIQNQAQLHQAGGAETEVAVPHLAMPGFNLRRRGYSKRTGDQMDLNGISQLLRRLSARQEKIIRLYFGLGCQRPHSALEIAQEFGVTPQVITGILGAAERKLAQEGLPSSQLRQAARGESHPSRGRSSPGGTDSQRSHHSHRG